MGRWRAALAVAGVAGYALLSHELMLHAADRPWAVAVLLGPLMLSVLMGAIARRQIGVAMACAAGAVGIALWLMYEPAPDVNRLYVAQHVIVHLALAWLFAHSLRPGGTPIITTLAWHAHGGQLRADMRAYTRRLTGWWVLFFGGMASASVAIYLLAPWNVWSLFGNLLTPLASVGFFLGEHVARYWRHPEFERVNPAVAMRAWRERHRTAPPDVADSRGVDATA